MAIFRKLTQFIGTFMKGDKTNDWDICPICHKTDEVIPIRYGKPNNELMEQADKGKVRLGGCMAANRPSRYCKRDNKEF